MGRHDFADDYGADYSDHYGDGQGDDPTEAVPVAGDVGQQLGPHYAPGALAELSPEQLAELYRTELRNGSRPTVIPPPAPLVLPDDRIERKVAAATLAAAGATALGAVATGVLENLRMLDGLPPWARFLIVAVFVPAAGAVAGYVARSNRAP